MINSFFAHPSHQGMLAVQGKDAAKFLQGYVTCDMDEVVPGQWRMGAICNLKGRMVTSFRMLNDNGNVLLNMHEELVPTTIDFLKKYIPFFKAEMVDLTTDYTILGVTGDSAAEALGPLVEGQLADSRPTPDAVSWESEGIHVIDAGSSPARYEVWSRREREAEIIARLTEHSKQESTESWSLLEMENGIGWVTGATSEEFIPQMMNLQLLDGISFTKGCYLGQEIVARMEYRGQLKRSMVRGSVTTNERPSVGDELVGDDGKRVGTVVSVTADSAGFDLLAVIQKNEDLPRCLLSSGDEVNLLPLPYMAENA